jgi:hypothetical protein
MATTPTYSWPLPDDTDLVKDGAEAIRDLGNAIDTTVSSTTGLVHIETQSPSAVASFSFSNDVFSSTYSDYLIVFNAIGSVDGQSWTLRVRVAGSDASGANYDRAGIAYNSANTSVSLGNTNQTSYSIGSISNLTRDGGSIYLFRPNLAEVTSFLQIGATRVSFATGMNLNAGKHNLATAYDSLTISIGSGNLTGQFKLFGVKQ